jgi:hypothetical protein
MIKLFLLIAGIAALHAQFISIGAKGGSPLDNPDSDV